MVIDEYFTIVLPRFKKGSAGTVALVGTVALSTSSFYNTDMDHIPKSVRRIFEKPNIDDWFVVTYLAKDDKLLGYSAFYFEGRKKEYEASCKAENAGTLTNVFVVFRGDSKKYDVNPNRQVTYEKGQPFKMKFNGEIIP